jgi:two-component system, OmpR family, phosphate regulon response regulator PhoB
MQKNKILIVEDESAIRDVLKYALGNIFHITEAETVKAAEKIIAISAPDLMIIDWMLPDKSGIELIKDLKKNQLTREIPIIMLTAKAEEANKIKALETGADDYVTKPFSPNELIARIKTVLRRGKTLITPDDTIHHHALTLSTKTCEVKINEHVLQLTKNEYKLLSFFLMHPENVYSRTKLLNFAIDSEKYVDERAVDALIKRLRQKLVKHGYAKYIQTVRGEGYKFKK